VWKNVFTDFSVCSKYTRDILKTQVGKIVFPECFCGERGVDKGGEKQLEGKRLAVVLDSGVSLFPHYFARIPCRIWRKNGNEKPRSRTMKKRAKYPMRLVIRRQSRINGRFAGKPPNTFYSFPRCFLWFPAKGSCSVTRA